MEIYRCWVDDRPCEPLTLLMPAVTAELATPSRGAGALDEQFTAKEVQDEAVKRFLPCEACRGIEQCAGKIAGTRLGATERKLLLELPPPDAAEGAAIAQGADRSTREAGKRALRKLFDLGLVNTERESIDLNVRSLEARVPGESFRRPYRFVTARLSPLGAALLPLIRSELEAGQRLRWGDRPMEALKAVRETGPALVSRLARSANEYAEKLRALRGMDSSGRRASLIASAALRVRRRSTRA